MRHEGAKVGARRRAAVVLLLSALVSVVLPGCSARPVYLVEGCVRQPLGQRSVARVWNDVLLDLIRQVVPAPTVHARNLFHTSAAMWDAWAAYDAGADGYFITEKHAADDPQGAREAAMSYAAYRLLLWRYAQVSDLPSAGQALDEAMAALCYDPAYTAIDDDTPAALGNRIAKAAIAYGAHDGAREEERYADSAYQPANEPLIVAEPGAAMRDPDHWQPLALERQLAQNNLPIPGKVQTFIGPHWGRVSSFAMPTSDSGTPIDPGPPPRLADPASEQDFKQQAVEVIRRSGELDATDGVTLDISPAAMGNNPLGTNDGGGHPLNPISGQSYRPNVVARADYARVLAEYWADGPQSETPPGHWNVLANQVSDALGTDLRIAGDGAPLDRLEWDVKLYFTLNGATHDAAVAAWGLKGFYDSPRPISMIRYMGGRGQSSDPAGPAYDRQGLPLVAGLIEVVTPESSAPGERHAHLADHVGEIALRAWRGFPTDPATETSGVAWIRAVEWVPYQRSTFVSPAFAGYVSGHSSFSRAAAQVLTEFTGSPFFPGGLWEWRVEQGELLHEDGPTRDVTLQWATYFDAADEAGVSRLYMGIHVAADDVAGRLIGAQCGEAAWELARRYFAGTARS
ncbi:MAG: vanadium-dependent haloperoxidase [Chloroflexota bacterium]|nr:vanadium-dependent haloperoxidase [Chloroflexota bacterium]